MVKVISGHSMLLKVVIALAAIPVGPPIVTMLLLLHRSEESVQGCLLFLLLQWRAPNGMLSCR